MAVEGAGAGIAPARRARLGLAWRALLRGLGRHPGQVLLSLLGIALGAAVVVAVDLANQASGRALQRAADRLAGPYTWQVLGGPRGVPEDWYRDLRLAGWRRLLPVLEGRLRLADGRRLALFGLDPLALPAAGGGPAAGAPRLAEGSVAALLTEPGAVLMMPATAGDLGLATGDTLVTSSGRSLHLSGLLAARDGAAGRWRGVALSDIASAQALLGRTGYLGWIAVAPPSGGAQAAWLGRLRDALPAGARLVPASQRGEALQALTRAFHLNLRAMSLLALLIGGFLVYNTLHFVVSRRRPLYARLRSLGLLPGELMALVLGEAALLGAAGALAGLPLGWLLGEGLARLEARTLSELYFASALYGLEPSPGALARGALLALGASLAAALGPAWAAARTPALAAQVRPGAGAPAAAAGPATPVPALAGLALAGLGLGVLAWAPRQSLDAGFVALFAILLGLLCLIPWLLPRLLLALRPAGASLGGAVAGLALGDLAATSRRSAVAVAALTLALASALGVAWMIGSFRAAVVDWLAVSLPADLYVGRGTGAGERGRGGLTPETVAALRDLPGVAAVGSGRRYYLQGPRGGLEVFAVGLPEDRPPRFQLLERQEGRPAAWARFRTGAVMISETLAYRHGLGPGDAIRLPTPGGGRSFPIAGVYRDYDPGPGTVLMAAGRYRRLWDDPLVDGLGIHLRPGADPTGVRAAVAAQLPGDGRWEITAGAATRREILGVFDRTFAVTAVLRSLILVVALIGVVAALLALQWDRARDQAVLRALGLTPGGLLGLNLAQAGLLGLLAGLLALPLGAVLAGLLVEVINRRAFGWGMALQPLPAPALETLGLALAAGLLAGLLPAWHLARLAPAAALREE